MVQALDNFLMIGDLRGWRNGSCARGDCLAIWQFYDALNLLDMNKNPSIEEFFDFNSCHLGISFGIL